MKIRKLYNQAVEHDEDSLLLMLDFLLFEKETIKFEDDESVLDLYFMDKHRAKMNKLLLEYKEKRGY